MSQVPALIWVQGSSVAWSEWDRAEEIGQDKWVVCGRVDEELAGTTTYQSKSLEEQAGGS